MSRMSVKSVLQRVGALDLLYEHANNLRKLRNRVDPQRLINEYFATHPVPKLHIGSGGNYLEGWLNTDLVPKSYRVVKLDATRPFPLPDSSIDFIFSEHMIEHIPYRDGVLMLRECYRVLKQGGVVRIATPDLAFLIDLFRADKTQLQKNYIAWTKTQFAHVSAAEDVFVVNNYFRDWGHQFIYDEKALRLALSEAGFASIDRCGLNESTSHDLVGLESEHRMPPGFLRLETIVMEAKK